MKAKNKILSILVVIALMIASVYVTIAVQNEKITELESEYTSLLEEAQADAAALQTQLQFFEDERQNAKEIVTELITGVDYTEDPVYVIGHRTPDSDTVASAIGMAYLLNSLGISAEARITGDLNLETEYAFTESGYTVPEILEDAAGKQLWLVDHSAGTQMVEGGEDARIVGIVDHHGIGDVQNAEPICVLSCPAGSTCSVICQLCDICGIELTEDVAGTLLIGVLSDTANMKSSSVTLLDQTAFSVLKERSGIADTDRLFNGMLEAALSYKGMSDKEIFYSDYKDYEYNGYHYGIGCVKVARPDLIPAMAERMQAVITEEIERDVEAELLLYHIYDPDYSTGYSGYCGKDKTFADTLIESVFGKSGEKQGEYYLFTPSLSRKKAIVPPIDAYLDTLK